ncbi:sensor histidine kinase [Halalkalibacter okhensis]|uniref:histidine kinase n=1 Tax=Halalkalibacter okhensis TaxID=333138 RepID=A0A0B0IA76_9BACI|nr:HAMP domain-containing sensor histidine kinase [Halalkalibacter okhensis]KHF39433.1 hypothetical protein LQ50_15345 [Halalkalibacter okhensis]
MFSFDNYLFVLLVVLVPVFVYYSYFFKKEYTQENSLLFGLLCCVSIILSMTYPLELSNGHIYDLRTIPWLLAFLYGGLNMGILATACIFIYRFIIGVDYGFFITLFTYSISFITVLLYLKNYRISNFKDKLRTSFTLTLINTLLVLAGLFYTQPYIESVTLPIFIIYFTLSHLVTIVIMIFIIESLREAEHSKVKLQQAERIKVVGELAASVAHEVRNPLTVVKGFIHIFKNESNLTTSQISSLALMDSELQRAEKIIHDYLSLAKTNTTDLEKIDMIELCNHVIYVTESYALLKGVTVLNQLQDTYYVTANRSELSQVFLNLIKNGIESIDEKGTLTLSSSKTKGYVQIDITDTGKGMSEEEIQRLGTPFYTTKDQGTGLGTMFCYKTIGHLHGEIKVKSILNEGTTVSVLLPLCRG